MLARNADDVGRIVKSRRNASGMTQQELATIIGVNRRWVGDLEAGHPRAELALVLDALDAVGALADVIDNPGSAPERVGTGTPFKGFEAWAGLSHPFKGLDMPKLAESQRKAILSMTSSINAQVLSDSQRKAILGLSGVVKALKDIAPTLEAARLYGGELPKVVDSNSSAAENDNAGSADHD